MYVRIAILLFLVCITASVESFAQSDWNTQLRPMLSDSLLKRAQVGVSVRNVQTNKIVFEQNGNQSFTPASNLKLVTTAAALDILGPEYRFTTSVMYSGDVSEGVFKGYLLIKGSGDPTLGSDKISGQIDYQKLIKSWIAAVKSKGVMHFKGTIVIDPTHFDYNPIPKDYTWGDIGNYYGAGSFGLNLNENQYAVTLKPGSRIGVTTSVVSLAPWDTSCTFINHINTGITGSGDQSIIYSSPYNELVYAEGTIPMGNNYTVKGSLSNPSKLLGQLMVAEMKTQGIIWDGGVSVLSLGDSVFSQQQWNPLIENRSPSVKDIAAYTNLVSNNLYAECLLKELAYKKTGKGTTDIGASQLKKYLAGNGIDTLGIVLRDGSGMSPFNAISPNQITLLLKKQGSNGIYVSCIPVAGNEGTVAHICKETNGKVRVKSGTMNGTTCYSGNVTGNSGNIYAVSLMVNKHEAKNRNIQRVLEKILLKIMEN